MVNDAVRRKATVGDRPKEIGADRRGRNSVRRARATSAPAGVRKPARLRANDAARATESAVDRRGMKNGAAPKAAAARLRTIAAMDLLRAMIAQANVPVVRPKTRRQSGHFDGIGLL